MFGFSVGKTRDAVRRQRGYMGRSPDTLALPHLLRCLRHLNSGGLLSGPRVTQDSKLAERPDIDRHVLRCWHEWEFDGSERRIILCVETDLELQPGCEGFDPKQLDELIAEATGIMRASASPIDSIRIVPQR